MVARVVINGLFLSSTNTGGGRYVSDLAGSLSSVDYDYTLLLNGSLDPGAYRTNPRVVPVSCGMLTALRPARVVWEHLVLPGFLKRRKCDLLHACGFTLPRTLDASIKTVLTIFDMTFFKMPDVHQASKRAYFTSRIPDAIRRAHAVIAISEQTRRDILAYVPGTADKIHVVPLGHRQLFASSESSAACLKQRLREMGFPQDYILFVGTIEPRKNLETLIEAYRMLVRQGFRQKLVLVGKKGWHYNNVFRLAQVEDLRGRVLFKGFVADRDMPAVFSGACLFAYPSLYEGFGIPVLEAMSCGVPVVTSSVSSLPEVTGDAALLIDPRDTRALASAMARALTEDSLRDTMRQKGWKRAEYFSLKRMAQQTERIYSKVLHS